MLFNFAAATAPVIQGYVAISGNDNSNTKLYIYPWLRESGFGSLRYDLSYPYVNYIYETGVAFNNAKTALAFVTKDLVEVWEWDNINGVLGSQFSAPATAPTGYLRNVTFSPSDDVLFIGSYDSPYIHAYEWNNSSGFGAKYSNPSTLPTGGSALQVHPSGNAVIVSSETQGSISSPRIYVYPWNYSTGFGTIMTNPTYPNNFYQIWGTYFTPSGDTLLTLGEDYLSSYSNRAIEFDSNGSGFVSPSPDTLIYTNEATDAVAGSNNVVFIGKNSSSASSTYAMYAYPYTENNFTLSSPYSDAVNMPKNYGAGSNSFFISGMAISEDNSVLLFTSSTTNLTSAGVYGFDFNDITGWGQKYNSPTELINSSVIRSAHSISITF